MAASVQANSLTVARGERVLFRDLSFTVSAGQVMAIHGRNGAGKTSLLRVLAGLLTPAAGSVVIAPPVLPEATQTVFHYCGHADAVKPALTVRETLEFWRRLHESPDNAVAKAIADWRLETLADLPGQYLSAGQRRRVSLARLTVATRPVWFLDEPAAALDSQARAILFWQGEAHLAAGGLIVAAAHETMWPQAAVLDLSRDAKAAA